MELEAKTAKKRTDFIFEMQNINFDKIHIQNIHLKILLTNMYAWIVSKGFDKCNYVNVYNYYLIASVSDLRYLLDCCYQVRNTTNTLMLTF